MVREPVREKELTPPARPVHPSPDPAVQPKHAPEAPARPTKEAENPDKDKPEPGRK
ncbi:MAG: hypothetical protein NT049_04815 [Planctomycetota bacterium]|nr:hypothetical protein [Planctomycetota bacterium]